MLDIPTLSFCITCKNRFHQIKETLPKNLADNALLKGKIEFVLVDFDSNDGLRAWILKNFLSELNKGYLKNTTHLFASNDILVNLDCDNYTGKNGGKLVIREFMRANSELVLHQFGGVYGDGTYGRISVLKKYFLQVGGYDESLEPMGYEDKDLIERLKCTGLIYRYKPSTVYSNAIRNTKEYSIKYCDTQLGYWDMQNRNEQKSIANIKEGRIKANSSLFGIQKNIFDYRNHEFTLSDMCLAEIN
jgi:glycosyltransferase involved in cell wall biosynthesis